MTDHEIYMNRCLELALMGQGNVSPNPLVGSVIVHENRIIGEGYHMRYGEAHAEVNAIQSVTDTTLLSSSTLYVNLEPCAHYGKTPPCANLIVEKKIPRVVIGCIDSFSEVAGKGIEHLKKSGVKVTVGVLEAESRYLNRRFFTFHEKQRPFVILKWAQTPDGFMDIDRSTGQKGTAWITEAATKSLVHRWRHEEDAILVGWKTVALDNPRLTCREIPGKNPIRVILDRSLRLDYNAFHVGNREARTIVLTEREATGDSMLSFVQPENFEPKEILRTLKQQGIQSVLIEGGATTLQTFIQSGFWDEARILTGNTWFKKGQKAPEISGNIQKKFDFGNDQITILSHD